MALVVLLLVPGACGQSQRRPPVLQRLAAMQRPLIALTVLSNTVAIDARRLRRSEREGRAASSKRLARILASHAGSLSRQAGVAANRLIVLGREASDPRVRIYIDTLALALGAEWNEGRALARLSRQVERDPYGIVPATAAVERSLASYAQATSARAAARLALAERLRRQYPRSFRYVPVPTPTPR